MPSAYRGKGGRRYRRTRDRLARQAQATNATCPSCGTTYNFTNPNSPQGFTADHPTPLNAGGSLNGQPLTGMCRSCNARKRDHITPTLKPAT